LKAKLAQFRQKRKTDTDKNELPNQEGIDVDCAYSFERRCETAIRNKGLVIAQ
jgi:hypothetical protein